MQDTIDAALHCRIQACRLRRQQHAAARVDGTGETEKDPGFGDDERVTPGVVGAVS